MPKYIGITDLRIKAKEVFDEIKREERPIVVMRDSRPEAVIVPYETYETMLQGEQVKWNERLDALIRKTKPKVAAWLQKKGYEPKKVTGDQFLKILEKEDAKRSR